MIYAEFCDSNCNHFPIILLTHTQRNTRPKDLEVHLQWDNYAYFNSISIASSKMLRQFHTITPHNMHK